MVLMLLLLKSRSWRSCLMMLTMMLGLSTSRGSPRGFPPVVLIPKASQKSFLKGRKINDDKGITNTMD